MVGKELIATYEWQRVGPDDTLPAGLEIRMDLSGGGKWARLPPKEVNPPHPDPPTSTHVKRCGPSCKERQRLRAEKRRSAGFLLREPRRAQQEQDQEFVHGSSSSSLYHEAGVLLVGIVIGVGAAMRVRKQAKGRHES